MISILGLCCCVCNCLDFCLIQTHNQQGGEGAETKSFIIKFESAREGAYRIWCLRKIPKDVKSSSDSPYESFGQASRTFIFAYRPRI